MSEMKTELDKFTKVMADKLYRNRHKNLGGPYGVQYCLRRLREELAECEAAMMEVRGPDAVEEECADIANFAMMVSLMYRTRYQQSTEK